MILITFSWCNFQALDLKPKTQKIDCSGHLLPIFLLLIEVKQQIFSSKYIASLAHKLKNKKYTTILYIILVNNFDSSPEL